MDDKLGQDSTGQTSVSRRNVLRMAGVGAAGVAAAGASQLLPQAATASPREDAPLLVQVVDYVDRQYVVRVTGGAAGNTAPLRLREGLRVETTEGAGEIREDRYTGNILVRPQAGEAISVRAVAPAGSTALARAGGRTSLASQPTSIGYDAADISDDELSTVIAGGGACASATGGEVLQSILSEMAGHVSDERRSVLAAVGSGEIESSLRVRAAVMGNVIPLSPAERVIQWQHARYYGQQSVLGLLRFTYDLNRDSVLTLRGGDNAFFPATAVNSIYCRMELLDLGTSAISANPMLLPSDSVTWPPYSTPMRLARPVEFYDESDPDRLVMTIIENEMSLYDYNGVTITKLGSRVTADGVLHAGFEITNQTERVLNGRWMLIGDHLDRSFAHTDAAITLGPAGVASATTQVNVEVPVGRSELSQRVGFAVLGLSDPLALGITPITFRYPYA